MTCDEAELLLQALIDGELDAGHARDVENHVAGCAHCTAMLRDYRQMSQAIAAAGAQYKAPLELRKRIENALPQPKAVPNRRAVLRGFGKAASIRARRAGGAV